MNRFNGLPPRAEAVETAWAFQSAISTGLKPGANENGRRGHEICGLGARKRERGRPCPRELYLTAQTRGHGCPRSNLESAPGANLRSGSKSSPFLAAPDRRPALQPAGPGNSPIPRRAGIITAPDSDLCRCAGYLSLRKGKPPPRPRWWRGRRSVPGSSRSPSSSGTA